MTLPVASINSARSIADPLDAVLTTANAVSRSVDRSRIRGITNDDIFDGLAVTLAREITLDELSRISTTVEILEVPQVVTRPQPSLPGIDGAPAVMTSTPSFGIDTGGRTPLLIEVLSAPEGRCSVAFHPHYKRPRKHPAERWWYSRSV